MRPLIYWARDRRATLRLTGRSANELSGRLTMDGEAVAFEFDLRTHKLTLGEGANRRTIQLNEYGWET
jgi:hypothetical protein